MAKREIEFTQDCYYHIYNRGCNREDIFYSYENYYFLIRKMQKYFVTEFVSAIAYCLMPNHYHFLLYQKCDRSVGKLIQYIFNGYTKAFNEMYSRTGTLFEGPFKAKLIEEPEDLPHICRYIHRNPLEAKLVKRLEDWEFSNYHEWIGIRNSCLVDKVFIQEHFQTGKDYQRFVLEYKSQEKSSDNINSYYLD
jgi:putative transposase